MKRILALLLTVVLLSLALTSCAYNYEKNAANLVSFDKTAFEASLKDLDVEEGDYAASADRNALALDSIYEDLADAAGTDDKVYTGSAAEPDVVYYCYYATADGLQFFTSDAMKAASPKSFQLGLSTLSDFEKAVATALDSYDFEGAYSSSTEATTPAADKFVSISYTMTKGGTDTAVTNLIVKLSDAPEDAALQALYAQLQAVNVGTTVEDAETAGVYTYAGGEGEDDDVTFTDAKVDYVITGTPVEFKFTDPNGAEKTSADGTKKDLKDVELTYFVYPVYYIDVNEFSMKTVVEDLIDDLDKDSLDAFHTDAEEEDGETVINDLGTKAVAYIDAKEAYETAKTAADEAQTAYNDAETAWNEAEEGDAKTAAETTKNEKYDALTTAQTELGTKTTDMNTAFTNLQTADKTAYDALEEDDKNKAIARNTVDSAIMTSYFQSVHESLLSSFNTSMKNKVYAAIYELIDAITVNEVPEKAVKNVYNDLIDAYEYTFYTGSSTDDTSVSNYKYYNDLAKETEGNDTAFELYLMEETASDTAAEAKEYVTEQAEKYVKQMIRVYAVADAFGVEISKKDLKEELEDYTAQYYYGYYLIGAFTDDAAKTAIYFDHLMAIIAESNTDDAGDLTWTMVSYAKE